MQDKIRTNIIIDEVGAKQVLWTFDLFRKAAILYLAWAVLSGLENLLHYAPYFQKPYHLWSNIYNFRIIPFMHFVHIVLGVTSYYFQFKAYNLQKLGIKTGDSALYVSSYKIFRKGIVLAMIITATIIMQILVTFASHNLIS